MVRGFIYAAGVILPLIIAVLGAALTGRLQSLITPPPCVIEQRQLEERQAALFGEQRPAMLWSLQVVGPNSPPGPLEYALSASGSEMYAVGLFERDDGPSTHPQADMLCWAANAQICDYAASRWNPCPSPHPGPQMPGVPIGCRSQIEITIDPAPYQKALAVAAFLATRDTSGVSVSLQGVESSQTCIFAERYLPRWLGILLALIAISLGLALAHGVNSHFKKASEAAS